MLIYAMHNYIVKMLRCDKPVSNFISSSFFNIPVFFNETLAWEQQDKTIHKEKVKDLE